MRPLSERLAARRYWRAVRPRPYAICPPRSGRKGEVPDTVPTRDRLAWWLADKALRLATEDYRRRLHKTYLRGLAGRIVAQQAIQEARAEAWGEGYGAGQDDYADCIDDPPRNPYRNTRGA